MSAVPTAHLQDIRQRMLDQLWAEEVAVEMLHGGDPTRDAYRAGCKAILRSWRDTLTAPK